MPEKRDDALNYVRGYLGTNKVLRQLRKFAQNPAWKPSEDQAITILRCRAEEAADMEPSFLIGKKGQRGKQQQQKRVTFPLSPVERVFAQPHEVDVQKRQAEKATERQGPSTRGRPPKYG